MVIAPRKAYCLIISFLVFFALPSAGQEQRIADSLALIYQSDRLQGEEKLELLRNLAFNELNDNELAFRYAQELIQLAEQRNDHLYLHRGHFQTGNRKQALGELAGALDAYLKSLEAAQQAGYTQGIGNAYGAIADVYSISNNHPSAKHYYARAITTLRETGESIGLAAALANAGDEFYNTNTLDTALVYFQESGQLFEKLDYVVGKAYSLGNIGMVYTKLGRYELAESHINEAIQILEEAEDYLPICEYLLSMSDIYQEKGEVQQAIAYARRSLEMAGTYGLKDQLSAASLKLSELYERIGDTRASYDYYKNHIVYRDSVNNLRTVQAMADLRTNFEVSQKQAEVDLLNEEKRNQRNQLIALVIILGLITVILGTLYWFYRAISREHKRSESLLLNILPVETAQELKNKGHVEAVKFEEVTVLFTDFVEFSKKAEHSKPELLVKSIDHYFRGFDEITSKYGLEKIKTIGDAYMCAGGLPVPQRETARKVVRAAREMVQLVNDALHQQDGLLHFEIRIGIHTGPVVAGIVGSKKWQYDIWGDTVNIAARMEAASRPGRINISETAYQEIKDEFECSYRGEIEVKNRGALKMYFMD